MANEIQDPLRIAIIGSNDPAREKELSLKNLDSSNLTGELLGHALAQKGHHIVVYSSEPQFFEDDVVRGYVAAESEHEKKIEVRYSQSQTVPPSFAEEDSDTKHIFDPKPDPNPNWEVSFYQSLKEVDGAILLGGGLSTLAAGMYLMSHNKPILACAAFGGSARKVWDVLSHQKKSFLLTEKDTSMMAEDNWTQQTALEAAAFFQKYIDYHQAALAKLERQKRDADKSIARYSWLAAFLFILALGCWPLVLGIGDITSGILSMVSVLVSLLAGGTGAIIRAVLDDETEMKQIIELRKNIPLGMIAGGFSALVFTLAQVNVDPTTLENALQAEQFSRLIPYSFGIGLVAGITFEQVFSQLRKKNVIDTTPLQGP